VAWGEPLQEVSSPEKLYYDSVTGFVNNGRNCRNSSISLTESLGKSNTGDKNHITRFSVN
jgi:hypothetical protein